MENEKNRQRALKAWKTIRDRGYIKYKDRPKEEFYNNPKKNEVRNKIVNLIKKYGGDKILTLETSNFILPSLMRNHTFFVAEENQEEYLKMIITKPKNVFLHYGNISQMSNLVQEFDTIYLDFCCGYKSAIPIINLLSKKLEESRLVGFTFCLRRNQTEKVEEDYTLDLVWKLNDFLGSNFRPIFKKSYADTSPMATLFFLNTKPKIENNNKEKNENEENEDYHEEKRLTWELKLKYGKELTKWAINKIHKVFPHIISPQQIFDGSAKTLLIKNRYGDVIIEKIFALALKEKIISGHRFEKFYNKEDLEGLRDFFTECIFRNIFELWRIKDKFDNVEYNHDINFMGLSNDGDDIFLNPTIQKSSCEICGEKCIVEYKNRHLCYYCFLKIKKWYPNDNPELFEEVDVTTYEGHMFPKTSSDHKYYLDHHCQICKNKLYKASLDLYDQRVKKYNREVNKFNKRREKILDNPSSTPKQKRELIDAHFELNSKKPEGYPTYEHTIKSKFYLYNHNCYCEECFNKIKDKIKEIIELHKGYHEEKNKKVLEIYGVPEIIN
jgi:hypothetical protein